MSPEKLIIDGIEVTPIRVPLNRVYRGSQYSMRNRCTIVTRIRTREGLTGESYNGDADEEQALIVRIIDEEIQPLLKGCDGWKVESCWERMLPITFNILRDRALGLQAMACVDSALWDLIGKAVGQPLVRLWGAYTDALPMVVIAGYYSDEPLAIEREAERYRELGFAGCKFKVGGRRPEEDASRVRRLRQAVGPDFIITADANQGYGLHDAITFGRLVSDCELTWFEEPCQWMNDQRWMRDVRMITGIPVAAGQSETTPAGARDLIASGAIDVCNFDASWSGGPTQWRRIAALASAYGVRMAHHEEAQISPHLLGSISHGTYVECFLPERDPVFWRLIANRGEINDGRYPVPQGAGLGLALDEPFMAKYRS